MALLFLHEIKPLARPDISNREAYFYPPLKIHSRCILYKQGKERKKISPLTSETIQNAHLITCLEDVAISSTEKIQQNIYPNY